MRRGDATRANRRYEVDAPPSTRRAIPRRPRRREPGSRGPASECDAGMRPGRITATRSTRRLRHAEQFQGDRGGVSPGPAAAAPMCGPAGQHLASTSVRDGCHGWRGERARRERLGQDVLERCRAGTRKPAIAHSERAGMCCPLTRALCGRARPERGYPQLPADKIPVPPAPTRGARRRFSAPAARAIRAAAAPGAPAP